jgi:hypothetical protein
MFGIVFPTVTLILESGDVSARSAMQFRIEFLDGSARVIRELFANARNAAGAIALIVDMDWPPRAITMRVLDDDDIAMGQRVSGNV